MKILLSILSIFILSVFFSSCDSVKTSNQGELSGEVNIKSIHNGINGTKLGELNFTVDVVGVKVILINENSGKKTITYTQNGKFHFTDLPDGSFTAIAHITDKIESKSNTIDIIGGESLTFSPITFDTFKSNGSNVSFKNVYPIPFKNIVTIEYQLIKEDTLNVFVFDLKGNLIAELIKGEDGREGTYTSYYSDKINEDGIYFFYIENKKDYSYTIAYRKE